ncbi:MAG: GLUG motif-containing protein, partial [Clostridia bacterium]
ANTISLAGIAIDNKGIIKNIASNLYIKNTSTGVATVSGGVINNTALASIINCKFIADMDAIVAHTTATPASLSGVAFDNKGMIDGVSVSGVIYAKCKVAGISMTNSGTIQNSSVASPSLYATNSVYGVVEINEASGKIIKTNASSLIYYFGTLAETAFAAGFVLTNNGNIEGCSVSGNILTTYTNTAMVLASGFAVTNNKAIKNSFVTNKAQVKGAYVAGFVFENSATADIWNSDVSATLVGKEYAVGFVYNNATTIYGSCFEGTIVSEKMAAGFVYDNKTNGVINNSFVKTQAIINEALSFNQISIEARIQVAGFAFINSGIIKNTYAITSLGLINSIAGGDIVKKAGGYVLTNNANAQIYNSYFVGNIQSNGTNLDKDIFANSDAGDIQNCYYNEDIANETSKYPYILAKSNAQMKNLEFYGEYYNQRIWSNVSGDYPKIKENAPISLYTPKLILTGTTISWGHNDLATAYYVLATDKLNNSVKYSIAIKTTTKIGSTTNTYYDSNTKTFAIDLMQIADTNFVLELGHEYDIQVVASSIDAGNYVNPFEADKVSTDKFYSVSLPSVAVAFNQYETPLGAGTLASPYEIQNARQLAWIKGNHSVAGGNHYYKLMKDIDLNNANWAPIGDVGNNFSGSFDGGGFSILNINIATGIDYVIKKGSASIIDKTNKVFDEKVVVSGLFGVIGTNGAVKNVKLNSTATNVNKAQITHNEIDFTYMYQMSGMLAGINLGIIEDVNFVNHASMTYDIAGTKCNSFIGGLVGYNAGTIRAQNKDYSVKANFDLKYTQGNATDVYVGGIAGANEGTIKNYSANASVSAQKKNVNEIKLNIYFGGIAGVNKNKGIIETVNSYVQIKSIANLNGLYVGGVAGENQAKIVDVITDGIINFNIANDFTSAYIGGVIGRNYIVNDKNIKNDVSNANSAVSITVTGSAKAVYAGGIIAEFVLANNSDDCNNSLKNSTYKGIIDIFNGEQYNTRVAGGIAGELSLGTKIEGCSTINASIKGYTVGGLVGINDGAISKCQAHGVADGLIVGGAVGYNQAIVTQTSTEATVYAYSTKANIDAGGFVGLADRHNDIKDSYCHNALFVIANSNNEINVGGFVGKLTAGNITNCYADNNITLYKPEIVDVEKKLATPYISLDKQNLVANDIPNATGYVVYAQGATDVNYSEVATINTLQGVTFTVENNLGTLQLALNCGVSKYIINATNPTIVVKAIAPKYTDSELSNTITIKNDTGIVSSSYQKPLRPEVMFEGDITAANSKIKVNAVNASGYQIYKKNNTTKVYAPFGNKLVSTLNQIEISIARRVNGVTYFSFNFNASLIAEEFVSDAAGDLFAVTVFDANGKESEKSNILDIKSSSVTTHIKQAETTITTDATGFTWAMPSGATAKLYYKNKEGKFVVSSGLVKGNRINVANENGTIKLSNTDNSVIEGALKYTSTVAIQIVGKDALEDSGLSNEITLTTFSGANTTQKIEAASLSYDVNNENIVVKTIEGVGKYRIYVKKANKFVPITLGGATDTSIIDGVSNDFIINVKIVINSSKIVFNFYFNGKLIYQTEDKSVVLAVTTVVGAEESSFSNAVTFANEPQGANGFAGNCTNKSDFKSCYFNTVNGNGLDFEKSSAKAITAETMKIKATFAGWDFDKTWDLGGVRPTLRN